MYFADAINNAWRSRQEQPLSAEAVLVVCTVLIFLLPIWAFPYMPTQDGPAHLANALILKDYGKPDNRFTEFYWISWRPLPYWTCYALLAGFAQVVPPLAAEKLLLSLYLIGFALAYRYFLGAVGNTSAWLVLAGFLLVFNRCLWLGFYNYCLSCVWYFVVVGYFLRCWKDFRWASALVLCLLFLLSYLTHLFGFVLTAGSCVWLALTLPGQPRQKYILLGAALLPFLVFGQVFFQGAHYHNHDASDFGQRLQEHLLSWVQGTEQWSRIKQDVFAWHRQLFGIDLDKTIYLGTGTALLYLSFLLASFFKPVAALPGQAAKQPALFGLGLGIALLYFLLPNFLGAGLPSLFKPRLVVLPLLLWLSCSRPTSVPSIRYALGFAVFVLLAWNLIIVTSYMGRVNRDLHELTAGVSAVGQDQTLAYNLGTYKEKYDPVNPFLHAINYYCLESQNISLGHNFTTEPHSVVRRHAEISEIREGDTDLAHYPDQAKVEVIVIWCSQFEPPAPGFQIIFQHGRLTILTRNEK